MKAVISSMWRDNRFINPSVHFLNLVQFFADNVKFWVKKWELCENLLNFMGNNVILFKAIL